MVEARLASVSAAGRFPGMRTTASYDLFPDAPSERAMARARWLAREGRVADAETAYRGVLATHPDLKPCWAEYFELLRTTGRAQDALRLAEGAEVQFSGGAFPLALKGAALIELARFPDALAVLERAVEADPDLALVWHELGYAAYRLGDPNRALLALDRAFALEPHTETLKLRGRILREAGRYAAAEVAFEAAAQAAEHREQREEAEREILATQRYAFWAPRRPDDLQPAERWFADTGAVVLAPVPGPVPPSDEAASGAPACRSRRTPWRSPSTPVPGSRAAACAFPSRRPGGSRDRSRPPDDVGEGDRPESVRPCRRPDQPRNLHAPYPHLPVPRGAGGGPGPDGRRPDRGLHRLPHPAQRRARSLQGWHPLPPQRRPRRSARPRHDHDVEDRAHGHPIRRRQGRRDRRPEEALPAGARAADAALHAAHRHRPRPLPRHPRAGREHQRAGHGLDPGRVLQPPGVHPGGGDRQARVARRLAGTRGGDGPGRDVRDGRVRTRLRHPAEGRAGRDSGVRQRGEPSGSAAGRRGGRQGRRRERRRGRHLQRRGARPARTARPRRRQETGLSLERRQGDHQRGVVGGAVRLAGPGRLGQRDHQGGQRAHYR